MTKRILGGLFVLIAVGALGVIVAGAVAEGDQLFVRFLTAVVVAALGLYVISDLRLQASKSSAQSSKRGRSDIFASDEKSDYLNDLGQTTVDKRELEVVGASYGGSGSVGYDLAELEELRESLSDLDEGEPIASSPTWSNNDDLVAIADDNPVETTNDQFAWPDTGKPVVADDVAIAQDDFAAEPVSQEPGSDAVVPEPNVEPPLAEVEEVQAVDTATEVAEEASIIDVHGQVGASTTAGETCSLPAFNSQASAETLPYSGVEDLEDLETTEDPSEASLIDLSVEPVKATPEVVDLREVIDLRGSDDSEFDSSLEEAIKLGEMTVVNTLLDQEMLTSEGEITDSDVRTMVYVAFTSNELRKLIKAGGVPGAQDPQLDLGPVELFDESTHTPAPKVLYQSSQSQKPQLPNSSD